MTKSKLNLKLTEKNLKIIKNLEGKNRNPPIARKNKIIKVINKEEKINILIMIRNKIITKMKKIFKIPNYLPVKMNSKSNRAQIRIQCLIL